MEGDLTWDGEHTIQYTHDVLQNCTPETYIILLTNVTPIKTIKKKQTSCKYRWDHTQEQVEAENISIPAGGEKPPTKEPPKHKNPSITRDPTQTEQRANIEHPGKEIRDHPLNLIEFLQQNITLQKQLAR